jgi:hypothetical protein
MRLILGRHPFSRTPISRPPILLPRSQPLKIDYQDCLVVLFLRPPFDDSQMPHLAFPHCWETELALERSRKHVGSACISLDVLEFQHEVDEQNVDRLVKLLQSKCDRTDTRNHVIATIDQQSLDLALKFSDLTTGLLTANAAGSYPILNLPPKLRIQCLHGVDRLAAARRFLPHGDQRWVVELYLAGTSLRIGVIPYIIITFLQISALI